jgi:hypothetical protein
MQTNFEIVAYLETVHDLHVQHIYLLNIFGHLHISFDIITFEVETVKILIYKTTILYVFCVGGKENIRT